MELLLAAVRALVPQLFPADVELLVEALKIAAKMQQDDVRGKSAVAGLLILLPSQGSPQPQPGQAQPGVPLPLPR